MKFVEWCKRTWYWYDEIILMIGSLFFVAGIIIGGAVWSANAYNEQVEKCNNAGGVYIKGQCVEGKVIKL